VRSVEVTLNKVLSLGDSDGISVRRKYKHGMHGRKARWWFVLHGSESTLANIEQKWESMTLQTGWKIEPCYRPSDTDSGSESGNSPAVIDQSPPSPENETVPSSNGNQQPPEDNDEAADATVGTAQPEALSASNHSQHSN
jgi:hypothetical protein